MADGINKFADYLKTRNSFARVRNAEKAIAEFRAIPVGQSAATGLRQADEARQINIDTGKYNLEQKKIIDPIKFETTEINRDIAKLKKDALTAPAQKPQKAYFRGFEFEVNPDGGINFSKDEVARDKYDQEVISKTVGAGTYSLVSEGSKRTVEDKMQAFTPLEIEKANAARYDRMLSIEAMNVARSFSMANPNTPIGPAVAYKRILQGVEYAKVYRSILGPRVKESLNPDLDRQLANSAIDAGFDVDDFGAFIYGGEGSDIGGFALRDALEYADYSVNILGK